MSIIIFSAWFLLIAGLASEAAARCPPAEREVEVVVHLPLPEATYGHHLGQQEIARLPGTTRSTLAQVQIDTLDEVSAEYDFGPGPREGLMCAYLKKVVYTVGFSRIHVSMPREYAERSCEYQALLRHENEHIAITGRVLSRLGPDLVKGLRESTRDIAPAVSADRGHATFVLNYQLEAILKRTRELLWRTHAKAQRAIDTFEEYTRIERSCTNWKPLQAATSSTSGS